MADLSLQLPIVIASPGDVREDRDAIDDVIRMQQKRGARHRLLIESVRWERDMRPSLGRPQSVFNDEHLRRAELVVFLFWSSFGSPSTAEGDETATLEELRLAQTLVRSGSSDDVFVYFRKPAAGTQGEKAVQDFRESLNRSKLATTWEYSNTPDLRETFQDHLGKWLDRWLGVPEICEETIWRVAPKLPNGERLRENRLHEILLHFDPAEHTAIAGRLGRVAVDAYQAEGAEGYWVPIPDGIPGIDAFVRPTESPPGSWSSLVRRRPSRQSNAPLVRTAQSRLQFAEAEWFYFFCAVGLLDAIQSQDVGAIERHPYVNNTHQYLAALVDRRPDLRPRVVAILADWLSGRASTARGRPVVRNFAAYVLGMLGAFEAENDLAEAARSDPGLDVRTYAICALGKLRSRRHLSLLVQMRTRASDERERMLLGQAICRITGVAHYEL